MTKINELWTRFDIWRGEHGIKAPFSPRKMVGFMFFVFFAIVVGSWLDPNDANIQASPEVIESQEPAFEALTVEGEPNIVVVNGVRYRRPIEGLPAMPVCGDGYAQDGPMGPERWNTCPEDYGLSWENLPTEEPDGLPLAYYFYK